MDRSTEFGADPQATRDLLRERQLAGLLLPDHSNVAWLAGGGRSYVSWAAEQGAARVLVTPTDVLLMTSNVEEWRNHLQSRLAGYRGRDWFAR